MSTAPEYHDRRTRWKLIVGHVVAWPLLLIGLIAVSTLFVIANQGYQGFGVEQGIVTAYFMVYVVLSAIGVLILVTVTGWKHLLSKIVVSVEVILLIAAVIGMVLGAE